MTTSNNNQDNSNHHEHASNNNEDTSNYHEHPLNHNEDTSDHHEHNSTLNHCEPRYIYIKKHQEAYDASDGICELIRQLIFFRYLLTDRFDGKSYDRLKRLKNEGKEILALIKRRCDSQSHFHQEPWFDAGEPDPLLKVCKKWKKKCATFRNYTWDYFLGRVELVDWLSLYRYFHGEEVDSSED